jgi:hypothetical protein
MNIYNLRKTMSVEYYFKHANGGAISYSRNNKINVLTLANDELLKELIAIGSLEDGDNYDNYALSQWDALNISIRFELAREAEKEIDNADIGKAIENLKNK